MKNYLKAFFSDKRKTALFIAALLIAVCAAVYFCYSGHRALTEKSPEKEPDIPTISEPLPQKETEEDIKEKPVLPESELLYSDYSEAADKLRTSEPNAHSDVLYGSVVKINAENEKRVLLHEYEGELPVLYISSEVQITSKITGIELPKSTIAILSSDNTAVESTGAFYENENLTVFLPSENLLYIGDKSFYGCRNLSKVFLPMKLCHIGDRAFGGCRSLKEISVFGRTSIGEGAFAGCTGLRDVYLSEKVQRVGLGAFEHTPFYENLTDKFCIVGDVLIKYNGKDENVVIPDGVRIIADGVFAGKLTVKTVTLPSGLEYVGNSAFRSCYNLTEVVFDKDTPPVLGENAFDGCPLINSAETAILNVDRRDMFFSDKTSDKIISDMLIKQE